MIKIKILLKEAYNKLPEDSTNNKQIKQLIYKYRQEYIK